MTSPLLLGVDAGSSRVRALIFTLEGDIVAEGSVTPSLETPYPGWATLDADQLWQACWQALRSPGGAHERVCKVMWCHLYP